MRKTKPLKLETLEARALLTGVVTDITPTSAGFADVSLSNATSYRGAKTEINDQTLILATTTEYGEELMAVDQSGRVALVKDIRPGLEDAEITQWTAFENDVYFQADDGNEREAWRSDGTEAGTFRLTSSGGRFGGGGSNFTKVGNQIYFDSHAGIYRSNLDDHSAAVRIDPGVADYQTVLGAVGNSAVIVRVSSTSPRQYTLRNHQGTADFTTSLASPAWRSVRFAAQFDDGRILFTGAREVPGQDAWDKDLWVTDGTRSGTQRLKAGIPDEFDETGFETLGDTFVFAANGSGVGSELWRTDGTPAGTYMVRDIWPGPMSSRPGAEAGFTTSRRNFTRLGNDVLFIADDGVHGVELWKTDGTFQGTKLVKDIYAGASHITGEGSPFQTPELEHLQIVQAKDGTNREPTRWWITDGTTAGTYSFKDLLPDSGIVEQAFWDLEELNGLWYFGVSIDQFGWELWKSDGTREGTGPVVETRQDYRRTHPQLLGTVGDNLIYAQDNRRDELAEIWKTDGTVEGTVRLASDPLDETPRSFFSNFFKPGVNVGDDLFVSRLRGDTTWATDGTPEGTRRVQVSTGEIRLPVILGAANDRVFFQASRAAFTRDIWRMNVNTSQADLVHEISEPRSDGFDFFEILGTQAFYTTTDQSDVAFDILYQVDSSSPTSRRVARIPSVQSMQAFDGDLYLLTRDIEGGNRQALWKYDVSSGSATEVATYGLARNISYDEFYLGEDRLYFNAASVEQFSRYSLYVTDGTEITGLYEEPSYGGIVGLVGDQVFFRGAGEGNTQELWVTNGTKGGTRQVKEINPAFGSAKITDGVPLGNYLYFGAHGGVSGEELWRSDGTAEGTERVIDLDPGARDTDPIPLGIVGGKLLFLSGAAFDRKTLWATDGTEAGTQQLSTTVFQSWFFNTAFDGKFYFGGLPWNSTDWDIYVTDGTPLGTSKTTTDVPVSDFRPPTGFVEVDNKLIITWGDRILSLTEQDDAQTLVPPIIDSFAVEPNVVMVGDTVTLTASGVTDSDGIVSSVQFYRDENNDGQLNRNVDQLLGEGIQRRSNWTLTTDTDGWAEGTNRLFAVAIDDLGVSSELSRASVDIVFGSDSQIVHPVDSSLVRGSVSGTRNEITRSDNRYQTITENLSMESGSLEKIWEFDLPAGRNATLGIEAFSNARDEVFYVIISTDGGRNWRRVMNVTKQADDNRSQTYQLPAGTSGQLLVKIRDSNITRDYNASRLSIDHLYVEVSGGSQQELPVVQITRSASGTIEGANQRVEFTISRSGNTDESLRVSYSVGGTAKSPNDYEPLPGYVTIPRGKAAVHVPILVVNDDVFEQEEELFIRLESDDDYELGDLTSAEFRILDDDEPNSDVFGPTDQLSRRGRVRSGGLASFAKRRQLPGSARSRFAANPSMAVRCSHFRGIGRREPGSLPREFQRSVLGQLLC